MLELEVVKKSLFKVLGLNFTNKFVTGKKFTVTARIRNPSDVTFEGGKAIVFWKWTNNLLVNWIFDVPKLEKNQVCHMRFGNSGKTDVLDSNPALFYAAIFDKNRNFIELLDFNKNKHSLQEINLKLGNIQLTKAYHVNSLIPINAEELYSFWALIIAVLAIIMSPVIEVILKHFKLL